MIDWRLMLTEFPICVAVCSFVDSLGLPLIPLYVVCLLIIVTGIYLTRRKERSK